MPATFKKFRLAAALGTMQVLVAAAARSADVKNLTGLPTYPSLTGAFMDPLWRTDILGRWCAHFSATSRDPVDRVETWYRQILVGASETDLSHDPAYQVYLGLDGIKLDIGVDWVAIYRVFNQTTTSIDLYRCTP
jgi:hypothetical protein